MTTTTKTSRRRIYPGLVCNGIEFFNEGGILMVISSGSVKRFEDAPYAYHQILQEAIDNEPKVKALLVEWFPDSDSNPKLKRLIQFGKCRFGGLDFQSDVKDYTLQAGEYSECPKRDTCPGAGILCKPPIHNGVEISFLEVKLVQALATNDTNECIAEKIPLPLGTFHLLKKEIICQARHTDKTGAGHNWPRP